jgi:hypothetical protein
MSTPGGQTAAAGARRRHSPAWAAGWMTDSTGKLRARANRVFTESIPLSAGNGHGPNVQRSNGRGNGSGPDAAEAAGRSALGARPGPADEEESI